MKSTMASDFNIGTQAQASGRLFLLLPKGSFQRLYGIQLPRVDREGAIYSIAHKSNILHFDDKPKATIPKSNFLFLSV
jgi:hypothetical protein